MERLIEQGEITYYDEEDNKDKEENCGEVDTIGAEGMTEGITSDVGITSNGDFLGIVGTIGGDGKSEVVSYIKTQIKLN